MGQCHFRAKKEVLKPDEEKDFAGLNWGKN